MKIVAWLAERAPDDHTPAPPVPVTTARPPRALPSPDTPDSDDLEHPNEHGVIDLEPIYTVIDYTDATGTQTRRRITMIRVGRGPKAPLLTATCHERRASRTFRCDRIECFIDEDGVVTPCHEFFRQVLLVDLDDLTPAKPPTAASTESTADRHQVTAREIRDQLRPALSILVTAARCDEDFHPEELDVICQYAETELVRGGRAPIYHGDVTIDTLDELLQLIRRMRPARSSLPGYLEQVLKFAPDRYARFVRALSAVIAADGRLADEEEDLMADVLDLKTAIEAERDNGWRQINY
ncbi:hypothetical protein [Pukyongiella litopenaei]|uniref:Co-chaperone DjlA N-terminal domain-containing protein n=1 Tax=Pukyongiella litopenaei TaxID=2605946 RepID=A0A2S0ML55_9RHOB|nr:hypothetical protein [Pukyongiella litopenaei]AVO36614.2 hypothetical protein C6Y53_02140 [Pukyongiella litopenaei]